MAKLELVFQAVTPEQHAKVVSDVVRLPNAARILISVAFVRSSGVTALGSALGSAAVAPVVFIGVRNNITSIQGVQALLDAGAEVYAVDTGSSQVIFHPKLYLSATASVGRLVVGSANLTFSGLHNNIEISTKVRLDMGLEEDAAFVNAVFVAFDHLKASHPKHVTQVKNPGDIQVMADLGRLVDEALMPAPVYVGKVKAGLTDVLGPMVLHHAVPPLPPLTPKPTATPKAKKAGSVVAPVAGATGPSVLVWQSRGLKERDLNIPHGKNTNPTGSMGMKKGAFAWIDQRHYFRDVVFDGLSWGPLPGSKREIATAKFELVIKGASHGSFDLEITHNPDTTTKTYQQGNMVTNLRWGSVRTLVGRKDLLGLTLNLYRKNGTPPSFLIEST